jgi:aconitate hydratase
MAPEYGATTGIFPIDEETLAYLRLTGRDDRVARVEAYAKEQGLWREAGAAPEFDETLELDLASVAPSVAGPRRPQDRILLSDLHDSFEADFPPPGGNGSGYPDVPVVAGGREAAIRTGSVAIAAITSCTNTSNPSVMVGAGLLARNAVERGLTVEPTVKTSLAPGSRAVTEYLRGAGLLPYLENLGFDVVCYGCTT